MIVSILIELTLWIVGLVAMWWANAPIWVLIVGGLLSLLFCAGPSFTIHSHYRWRRLKQRGPSGRDDGNLRQHAKELVAAERNFEQTTNGFWVGTAFAVIYLVILTFFVPWSARWLALVAVGLIQSIVTFVWGANAIKRLPPLD